MGRHLRRGRDRRREYRSVAGGARPQELSESTPFFVVACCLLPRPARGLGRTLPPVRSAYLDARAGRVFFGAPAGGEGSGDRVIGSLRRRAVKIEAEQPFYASVADAACRLETQGISMSGLSAEDQARIAEIGFDCWLDETADRQEAAKQARKEAATVQQATKLCALGSRCCRASNRRGYPVSRRYSDYCSSACLARAKILRAKAGQQGWVETDGAVVILPAPKRSHPRHPGRSVGGRGRIGGLGGSPAPPRGLWARECAVTAHSRRQSGGLPMLWQAPKR